VFIHTITSCVVGIRNQSRSWRWRWQNSFQNSGRCEQEILTDFNDYSALKKRYNIPGSILNNRDISQMKDLHSAFLLCQSIINKRKKIQAARKAAAADASTAAAALSNVVNTSISSTSTAADSSTSSSTIANKNRARIDYTPLSSGISSSLCASSNDTTRASICINSLSDQSSISASHSAKKSLPASRQMHPLVCLFCVWIYSIHHLRELQIHLQQICPHQPIMLRLIVMVCIRIIFLLP
jgi:hypothetical protein